MNSFSVGGLQVQASQYKNDALAYKQAKESKYGITADAAKVTAVTNTYNALIAAEQADSLNYGSEGEPPELVAFNAAVLALKADVDAKSKVKYDEKPTLAAVKTDLAKTTAGSLGAVVNATVESNTKIAKKADLDAQAVKINQAIQMIDKETSNWPDSDVAPNPITDAGLTAAQIYNLRSTTYPYTEWGDDADPVAWCNRHLADMYHVGAAKGAAGNEHTGKSFAFKKVSGTNNYTWLLRMDNEGIKAYKEIQEVTKPGGTLTQLEASVKTDAQNKANAAKDAAISAAATDAQSKVTAAKTELNTAIGKKVDTTTFTSFKTTNTEAINTAKSEAISAAATDAQSKANAALASAKTDATTKANNAKDAAISAAASDATTKANAAKSGAISAAATDATTKANTAKADAVAAAKTETTTQVNTAKQALNTEIAKKINTTDVGSKMQEVITATDETATAIQNAIGTNVSAKLNNDEAFKESVKGEAAYSYSLWKSSDFIKNGQGSITYVLTIMRGAENVTAEMANYIKWYVQPKGAAQSTTPAAVGASYTNSDPSKSVKCIFDK